MAGNPVTYAEDVLGVHKIWDEAKVRLEEHGQHTTNRAALLTDLRTCRADQADREAVLIIEVTAKYAEQSDTARNKIVKQTVHDDEDHQKLRWLERQIQSRLDEVEGAISHHEKGLSVLSARMVELGGLLTFYAAARSNTSSASASS